MSYDGSVAAVFVGDWFEGDDLFRWSKPNGYETINISDSWTSHSVSAISDDGSTIVGGDVTGDGQVTADDRQAWVHDLAMTFFGDANLDGQVNAADLNALALNWRADDATSWGQGDFNGNGLVNAIDLNDLALNWRSGSIQTSPVPEPSSIGLIAMAGLLMSCVVVTDAALLKSQNRFCPRFACVKPVLSATTWPDQASLRFVHRARLCESRPTHGHSKARNLETFTIRDRRGRRKGRNCGQSPANSQVKTAMTTVTRNARISPPVPTLIYVTKVTENEGGGERGRIISRNSR